MKNILIIISFFISVEGISQSFHNTGLPIGVTTGGILKVHENLVNTGNFLNNGQVNVGGAWQNNGVYNAGSSGVLEMDGTNVQPMSDHSAIEILRLTGGDKQLQTDLVVDQLILNGSKLIVESGFTIEVTGTISRQPDDYIIGELIRTGNQTFPIGTTNYFLPVTLSNLTSEGASVGVKAVETKLSGPLDNTVAEVAPYHWELSETADEFNVQLGFEDADFLLTLENAMVVQSPSTNGLIKSLYKDSVGGTPQSGVITNNLEHAVTEPYLSIGRMFIPSEKPPVNVLNLVSPNSDGKNDFLFIENIEAYPESLVIIYDRWGTKVFEVTGYKNKDHNFHGFGNQINKNELTEGTYYFVIRSEGEKLTSGFFELMR